MMPDPRRASDVPDDFRKAFIEAYYAEHGDWPGATMILSAWSEANRGA